MEIQDEKKRLGLENKQIGVNTGKAAGRTAAATPAIDSSINIAGRAVDRF